MGSSGLFKQSNIASRRLYNVKQWKELCESDKYATPDFFKSNAERDQKAREERKNATVKRPAKGAATRAAKRAAAMKKEDTPALSVASEAPTMEDHEAMKDQPAEQAPEDIKPDITMDVDTSAAAVIAPPSPATSTEQEILQQAESATTSKTEENAEAGQLSTTIPATPSKETTALLKEGASAPGTDKSEVKAGETSTRKKRKAREEDQENWDEEWEKFDYASLPHGKSL